MSSERVEAIRQLLNDGDFRNEETGVTLAQDAVADLLTALAQAERERAIQHTCTKCGHVTATQYGEELRAEVERLKAHDILAESAVFVGGLNGALRDLLSRYMMPCPAPCVHANCSVLRDLHTILADSRTQIINAGNIVRAREADLARVRADNEHLKRAMDEANSEVLRLRAALEGRG